MSNNNNKKTTGEIRLLKLCSQPQICQGTESGIQAYSSRKTTASSQGPCCPVFTPAISNSE